MKIIKSKHIIFNSDGGNNCFKNYDKKNDQKELNVKPLSEKKFKHSSRNVLSIVKPKEISTLQTAYITMTTENNYYKHNFVSDTSNKNSSLNNNETNNILEISNQIINNKEAFKISPESKRMKTTGNFNYDRKYKLEKTIYLDDAKNSNLVVIEPLLKTEYKNIKSKSLKKIDINQWNPLKNLKYNSLGYCLRKGSNIDLKDLERKYKPDLHEFYIGKEVLNIRKKEHFLKNYTEEIKDIYKRTRLISPIFEFINCDMNKLTNFVRKRKKEENDFIKNMMTIQDKNNLIRDTLNQGNLPIDFLYTTKGLTNKVKRNFITLRKEQKLIFKPGFFSNSKFSYTSSMKNFYSKYSNDKNKRERIFSTLL